MNLREFRSLMLAALSALAGVAAALMLGIPLHGPDVGELWRIFFSVRIPEAETAALVGGGLGLSGLLFQLVLRNALADPYVLGVAGGSTFGAVLATLAMGATAAAAGIPLRALAAFAGGIVTLICLLKVSRGKASTLILAGVIANTAFAAGARVLTVFFSPTQLAYVTTFLVGYIPTPPRWAPLLLVPPTLYTLGRFIARGRGLDLLLLSDDEASTLGLAVGRVRREALVLATLLASAAVALCGMIGFVGLVVPHVARLLAGNRHRVLVPASFLFGAAFLLLAHAFGKAMAGTWFLPVGVYTSLIGAPAFLVLLVRTSRRDWI